MDKSKMEVTTRVKNIKLLVPTTTKEISKGFHEEDSVNRGIDVSL